MTERIDERLEMMGVDTSGMSDEQKFTAATGLTRYAEYEANNPWYVPGGAANVPVGAEESGEQGQPTGTQPTGEQPTGAQPTGEQPTGAQPTGESEVATYTAEEAAAYNSTLEDALQAGVELSEAQAQAYNIGMHLAEDGKAQGDTLTEEEAAAYNATLPDAVKEGDPKPSTAEVETGENGGE